MAHMQHRAVGPGAAASRWRRGLILLGASLLLSCSSPSAPVKHQGPGWVDLERVSQIQAGEWLVNGRTLDGERFSPLASINAGNVARLGFAWEFKDFVVRGGIHRGVEANPVMVDGVLYFPGPWGVVYAVDARNGKALWTYDPQADGSAGRLACCDVVNRGVMVWRGKVFVGSTDGWLVAVDAKTGKPVWRADTIIDRHFSYSITGAPQVAGDNILIGNAGADMGARGYVSAYNMDTGKLAWRFYAVPGDPAKGPDETPDVTLARKTWSKDTRWEFGGGGNAWDSIVYDPKLGLAYLGLGNGSPHPQWLRSPGGGDNLFLGSIVAVDVKTGRMKWYYQQTPGDSWDFNSCAPMVMADLKIGGRIRQVLMQAPKNGFFYVIDRQTGELLKADPFTSVTWADGVDLKTGRPRLTPAADYSQHPSIMSPSVSGGHAWQPMSWNPQTGLVYFPVYEAAMKSIVQPLDHFVPGALNQQQDGQFPPFTSAQDVRMLKGQSQAFDARLVAWDPVAGRAVWKSEPLPFISGGVLSTAAGLVFEGSTDGVLSVYDAAGGKRLKTIQTGTAIMAAPITYALDGVQYVAVIGGFGGPQQGAFGAGLAPAKYENFERLMVFKLDGGATPLPPPAVPPAPQPTPAPIAADAATLAKGEAQYKLLCQRCHLVGGAFGAFPNLWNMSPATLAAFDGIVRGGAYKYAGMGDFSDVLSPADAAGIKAFIVDDEIKKRGAGNAAGAQSRTRYH